MTARGFIVEDKRHGETAIVPKLILCCPVFDFLLNTGQFRHQARLIDQSVAYSDLSTFSPHGVSVSFWGVWLVPDHQQDE